MCFSSKRMNLDGGFLNRYYLHQSNLKIDHTSLPGQPDDRMQPTPPRKMLVFVYNFIRYKYLIFINVFFPEHHVCAL